MNCQWRFAHDRVASAATPEVFMRIAGILALALLTAAPAAAEDTWSTFTDPAGVFRIEMPQEPVAITGTHPTPDGRTAKGETYVVNRGATGMMVKVDDYVGPPQDPAVLLERGVAGLQLHDRKLVSDASITIGGHVGRAVALVAATGARMTDRLFFIDNRIYQMLTTVPANASKDQVDMVERCAASLHFLK
jgi:hypothetical protein